MSWWEPKEATLVPPPSPDEAARDVLQAVEMYIDCCFERRAIPGVDDALNAACVEASKHPVGGQWHDNPAIVALIKARDSQVDAARITLESALSRLARRTPGGKGP